jgi:GT2 family glycosyltransferase
LLNDAPATSDPVSTPLVHCIILNWNGWADTLPCLQSLTTQDYPALRVTVVDNGSTDDSVARIRVAFPQVTILEAGANLGFPSGCNIGIRHAMQEGSHYIWLLNNDTVAPPDSCSKLVARAHEQPGAGIIGSILYFMHRPDKVQAWGGGNVTICLSYSTHFHAPAPLGPKSYLTFASVLIPREVIEKVGLLYEGYFMYWEDADYALRVTKAGYSLAIAEDTAILHKEGGSADPRSPVIDRYALASGLHFLRRHAALPSLSIFLYLSTRLTGRLLRREWKNIRALFLAIGDYRRQRGKIFRETL